MEHIDLILQRVEFLAGDDEFVLGQREFARTLSCHPVPLAALLAAELPPSTGSVLWRQHMTAPATSGVAGECARLGIGVPPLLPCSCTFRHDENIGASRIGLVDLPAAPERLFASDNFSGAHPRYLEAMSRANVGHQPAYGLDSHTRAATELFRQFLDLEVDVLFTFGGTGSNVVALGSVLGPAQSVVCAACSHINVDETGAPEKFLGAKLQDVDSPDGKISPHQVEALLHGLGNIHHVQPGVVSITQATELGTTYSVDEIRALCEIAHDAKLTVHLDGARIANAVAAMGGGPETLRALTFGAGVDVVSFGGTKNGMVNAEAVLLRPGLAPHAPLVQKQSTQLPSKMRYVASQFVEALSDGLWLETATTANRRAHQLYDELGDIHSLRISPPQVNSLYPLLPREAKEALQAWSFFWDWDSSCGQVRWMTSWDTTPEDVSRFAAGVRAALGG